MSWFAVQPVAVEFHRSFLKLKQPLKVDDFGWTFYLEMVKFWLELNDVYRCFIYMEHGSILLELDDLDVFDVDNGCLEFPQHTGF